MNSSLIKPRHPELVSGSIKKMLNLELVSMVSMT